MDLVVILIIANTQEEGSNNLDSASSIISNSIQLSWPPDILDTELCKRRSQFEYNHCLRWDLRNIFSDFLLLEPLLVFSPPLAELINFWVKTAILTTSIFGFMRPYQFSIIYIVVAIKSLFFRRSQFNCLLRRKVHLDRHTPVIASFLIGSSDNSFIHQLEDFDIQSSQLAVTFSYCWGNNLCKQLRDSGHTSWHH